MKIPESQKIARKFTRRTLCFQCDGYITCKANKQVGTCLRSIQYSSAVNMVVASLIFRDPDMEARVKDRLKLNT